MVMRGVYCLLMVLEDDASIRVGALGRVRFPAGVYVYVGSAMQGVEARVRRHLQKAKRRRWHIDYFLSAAHIATVVTIPADSKDVECSVAKSLLRSPGAEVPVRGFGSSDCGCRSHLFRFTGDEPARLLEEVAARISMDCCPYPERILPE